MSAEVWEPRDRADPKSLNYQMTMLFRSLLPKNPDGTYKITPTEVATYFPAGDSRRPGIAGGDHLTRQSVFSYLGSKTLDDKPEMPPNLNGDTCNRIAEAAHVDLRLVAVYRDGPNAGEIMPPGAVGPGFLRPPKKFTSKKVTGKKTTSGTRTTSGRQRKKAAPKADQS